MLIRLYKNLFHLNLISSVTFVLMIEVDGILLSEDIFESYFVCDLSACKGACCVEGDSGAPLKLEEIGSIEENLKEILPFLSEEGRITIKERGVYEVDVDGDYVTTLNNGKECAFTTFDENGTALCGIEAAYRAGKTNFKKPISCHLYPIRVNELKHYSALNYHRWSICDSARECGAKLKIKIYQFAKEALIREYGEEFYEKLVEVNRLLEKRK